jgi:hypothetical protein
VEHEQGTIRLADNSERCLNCSRALPDGDNYCAVCGQKRQPLRRTMRDIGAEFWDSTLGIDSKLIRSFRNLLFRPGFLTAAYLQGKRVEYLRPVSLFLLTAGILFLTLEWMAGANIERELISSGRKLVSISVLPGFNITVPSSELERIRKASDDELVTIVGLEKEELPQFVRRILKEALRTIRDDGVAVLRQQIAGVASKLVPILVPLMAILVKLLHLRKQLYFAEAVVYCLHLHAVAFIGCAMLIAIPSELLQARLSPILAVLAIIYTTASLHVSFQNSIILSFFKAGTLLLVHMLVSFALTLALIMWLLYFA